jgi:ribonuclease T2
MALPKHRVLLIAAVLLALLGSLPAVGAEQYVLAVSWQPAFCETRPDKPECRSQTEDRFDASHFALHGLWPQPRGNVYCGVAAPVRAIDEAGAWNRLPAIGLTEPTRTELERVMPGSRSFLHRHEWIKHGTCYGASPEGYYADSLRLMGELNASPVRDLLAAGIGRVVTAGAIRRQFDLAFGDGAGRRVEVSCRRVGARRLIVELKIHLAGQIVPESGLGALLAGAPETSPGCRSGIVDRVGTGLADDPS